MAKIDSETKLVYIKTSVIVGICLLLGLIWLWWVVVYTSPKTVFRAMLSNSLSTPGVTKTVKQEDQTGSLEQVSQAYFGAHTYVDVRTTISQQSDTGNTKIATQTIGDTTNNYVRYTDIEIPAQNNKPNPDFSSLINVWGKQATHQSNENVFTEAVFGAVLFGYLPAEKRAELLAKIVGDNMYEVNYKNVERTKQNGRSVYVYPAKLNTKKYIELIKQYDKMLGLELTSGLDPKAYNDAPAISVKLTTDVLSRSLTKLEYVDQNRSEEYAAYGINRPVELPQSPISRQELEAKLQEVLNTSQ